MEIRKLLNTCAVKGRKLYSSLNTWGYHFQEQKKEEFIKDLLEANQKITEREVKQQELVLLQIEQDTAYFIRFTRLT